MIKNVLAVVSFIDQDELKVISYDDMEQFEENFDRLKPSISVCRIKRDFRNYNTLNTMRSNLRTYVSSGTQDTVLNNQIAAMEVYYEFKPEIDAQNLKEVMTPQNCWNIYDWVPVITLNDDGGEIIVEKQPFSGQLRTKVSMSLYKKYSFEEIDKAVEAAKKQAAAVTFKEIQR